jgi:hypothetical protein
MKIIGNDIVCTEKYFFNRFDKDSIKTTFRQNKQGRVFLKQFQEFKNGIIVNNKTF